MSFSPELEFFEKCQKGYQASELDQLSQMRLDRPAYGTYAVVLAQVDGDPGQELVVGIPRGQNETGDLVGKVTRIALSKGECSF